MQACWMEPIPEHELIGMGSDFSAIRIKRRLGAILEAEEIRTIAPRCTRGIRKRFIYAL